VGSPEREVQVRLLTSMEAAFLSKRRHPHDPDRVALVRQRVLQEREVLLLIKSGTDDLNVKVRVKRALRRLDDIEGPRFLGRLVRAGSLTEEEESAMLDWAEAILLAVEFHRRAVDFNPE
jgi:hypothetical protein